MEDNIKLAHNITSWTVQVKLRKIGYTWLIIKPSGLSKLN